MKGSGHIAGPSMYTIQRTKRGTATRSPAMGPAGPFRAGRVPRTSRAPQVAIETAETERKSTSREAEDLSGETEKEDQQRRVRKVDVLVKQPSPAHEVRGDDDLGIPEKDEKGRENGGDGAGGDERDEFRSPDFHCTTRHASPGSISSTTLVLVLRKR